MLSCPVGSIRTYNPDPAIKEAFQLFPAEVKSNLLQLSTILFCSILFCSIIVILSSVFYGYDAFVLMCELSDHAN